jgi:aminocarboxymuconate-semialdehyde decarboxylase
VTDRDSQPREFLHACATHEFATASGRRGVRSGLVRRVSGRTKTVDVHCHVHNPAIDEVVAGSSGFLAERAQSARVWGDDGARKLAEAVRALMPKLTDPAERLLDMDRQGIDMQAISPSPVQYYYWASYDEAKTIVELCNARIAHICGQHPDRFVGFGSVAMQHTDLALTQMDAGVRQYGLRGFEVSSSINGKELSDPLFESFWAKAAELDVAIFIHPLGSPLGQRLSPYYLSNIVAQPMETTIALSMMIFSGLFDRYPQLKVLAAHGGGFLPLCSGRSDQGHSVRPEAKGCKLPPSEYLKRIFYDAVVFHPEALADLINRVGSSQVLLGTDYPFDMGEDDPLSLVSLISNLSESQCAALLGENAKRLLALD